MALIRNIWEVRVYSPLLWTYRPLVTFVLKTMSDFALLPTIKFMSQVAQIISHMRLVIIWIFNTEAYHRNTQLILTFLCLIIFIFWIFISLFRLLYLRTSLFQFLYWLLITFLYIIFCTFIFTINMYAFILVILILWLSLSDKFLPCLLPFL